MSLIAFLIIGFLAGLIARAIVPGSQSMGVLATTGLGVLGSFVGGLLSSFLASNGNWLDLHPTGLVFSIIGAIAVLAVMGFVGRPRARA